MNLLRVSVISLGVGLFAGVAASVFLYLLQWMGQLRDTNGYIVWFLPVAGFVIGAVYHYYGRDAGRGTEMILHEVEIPQYRLPLRMAPLVLFGTLLTHLFGGSAGREGTSVQMGAVLADQWGRWVKLTEGDRTALLIAGMGAGFGAAIGTPIAGIVFGLEVSRRLTRSWKLLIPSGWASVAAYFVTLALGAPHSHFPQVLIPAFHWGLIIFVVMAGIAFGCIAYLYLLIAHVWESGFRAIRYEPLRPVVGGLLIVALYNWESSYRYVGLGIETIQSAFLTPSFFMDPWYKIVFTALTIASGFKGGEFIPLVFIGATLGSCVGVFFPYYFSLAAGLGFASVFAAASKTPWACSIMAIELFGPSIAPYVFVSCWLATYFSGSRSIYGAAKDI